MLNFKVTEKTAEMEDVGTYTSYGLRCEDSISGETAEVDDITSKPEVAEKLHELCENGQVSPAHLVDVVSDYVADLYTKKA